MQGHGGIRLPCLLHFFPIKQYDIFNIQVNFKIQFIMPGDTAATEIKVNKNFVLTRNMAVHHSLIPPQKQNPTKDAGFAII